MEMQTGLEGVKQKARRFLHLTSEDENVIDIAFATYVGNRLGGDPLWVCIIGPPASGKTEIIASMDGYASVFLLSSLTPNTFISGKESTSPNERNPSLLPRLDGKLVLFKDLTTILMKHRDAKSEIFSQLREIYDGRYVKAFGTGKTEDWKGKFGILAGVTPVIDREFAINSLLGERFLYYRMHTRDHANAARMAIERTTGSDAYREDFQRAVHGFLTWLDSNLHTDVSFGADTKQCLVNLATLCTHARSAVLRNRDQTLQSMPEPEGPSRMVKQLSLLAKALTLVHGKDSVDQVIYALVKEVARDSLPRLRLKVLEALWEMFIEGWEVQDGEIVWPWHRTSEITERANLPPATARLVLEDLMLLNLVMRSAEVTGNAHVWQPSKRMNEWAIESEFFVDSQKALSADDSISAIA
jgi:hypothetical protein